TVGISDPATLERLSRCYWFACQEFVQGSHSPDTTVTHLHHHHIHHIIHHHLHHLLFGRLMAMPSEYLPLLLKAVLHSCRVKPE
ncbi:unnamed protein product, partial [Lampetra planeri]